MSYGIIFAYNGMAQWGYLNVQSITVKGNTLLSEQQIIENSHLQPGTNILAMNLSAAKKRLVTHPMIADVAIRRDFPSGIIIHVKEQRPMAVLDVGRTFVINYLGEIFMEVSSPVFKNIPVIVGFKPSDIDSMGTIHQFAFDEVIEILHLGLKPGSVLPTEGIQHIHVDKQTGLTVSTSGRIKTIALGYGDYAKKCERLKLIYSFLNDRPDLQRFVSIDLNNLKRIVLKPS